MIATPLSSLVQHLRRFHRDESGGVTIEFILFIPFFFAFFVSSFEMGMMMVRQTMLDRGLDLATRDIQLGRMVDASGQQAVTRENIRLAICTYSLSVDRTGNGRGMIKDCDNNLRVEMLRMDPHDWAAGASAAVAGAECRDRDDPNASPVGGFQVGGINELIVLRVCALVEPMATAAGIGAYLQRRSGDHYALFSMSAFVVEP